MPYAPKPRPSQNKNIKLGRAFLLHLRHSRLTSLLAILVTLPTFATVIISILHTDTSTLRDAATPVSNHVPADPFALPRTNPNRSTITIPEYLQHQSSLSHTSSKGISLLAACMNRRQSLQFSLPSWLSIPQITQVILVDWSSTPPLSLPPTHESHISIIRVENAETWILSRAYNLASKFATGKYILKVDCDTHLEPSFLRTHPLPPSGKYYTALTHPDTYALRGVWFAHTRDFFRIGGYDERIVEYGYEDTDLYRRFDAFLQPIPLDLDSVRHHTTGDTHQHHSARSHKISTLMNAAFLQNATSWGTTHATNPSTYTFSFDESENMLYASITSKPPAVHESTPEETVKSVRAHVLRETLHSHGLPRALLDGLDLADQEFLAGYFEADVNNRVIVAVLDSDTLGNVFNLVSALVAGITTGRPVITLWRGDHADDIHAIDVAATNRRLGEAVKTVSARRHGFSQATRIIPARGWGCVDAACTHDSYQTFVHVGVKGVYDARNPLPVPLKHHAFVTLDGMKIGGDETRALAYGCITWSPEVTTQLRSFRDDVAVAVMAAGDVDPGRLARVSGRVGVVGERAKVVRRVHGIGCEMCEKDVYTRVANVVAVVAAKKVLPETVVRDWAPVANSFVADLRKLHRAVIGSLV